MKDLQTVAFGLMVVFLDVGTPDWVADPLGWLLVLVGIAAAREHLSDYGYLSLTAWVCLGLSAVTWPPESVSHLDDTLGWLFSLPTLAFCFMLADSLTDVTRSDLAGRFRAICWAYAVVTVLPLVVLLMEWSALETPAVILTYVVHVALVLSLFSASDEDAPVAAERDARSTASTKEPSSKPSDKPGRGATARSREAATGALDNVKRSVKDGAAETVAGAKGAAQEVKGKVRGDGPVRSGSAREDQAASAAEQGRHKA